MFGSQYGAIRVVIELNVLRPPPQEQWKAVGEHEAHHHLQTLGPALRWTEEAPCPVMRANELSQLTASAQECGLDVRTLLGAKCCGRSRCGRHCCLVKRT